MAAVPPSPLEDVIVSDDGTTTTYVFPGSTKGCKDLILRVAANVDQSLPVVQTQEVDWGYDTNHTMGDPGSGECRANNSLIPNVTQWAVDTLSSAGVDRTQFLSTLKQGDSISIQDKNDATVWVRHTISAVPTNNSGWFLIPVIYVSSSGISPKQNDVLMWSFSMTGSGGAGVPDPLTLNQLYIGPRARLTAVSGATSGVKLEIQNNLGSWVTQVQYTLPT